MLYHKNLFILNKINYQLKILIKLVINTVLVTLPNHKFILNFLVLV